MPALLKATDVLLHGFSDQVFDSQSVFRTVLDAFSHPGKVVRIAPQPPAQAPMTLASTAICLALLDFETPLWLQPVLPGAQQQSIVRHLRFHCGCPIVAEPRQARFALIHAAAAMPALDAFHQGEIEYPDRSATLIVQVSGLDADTGEGVRLRGPGINSSATPPASLSVEGLPPDFWRQWADNASRFPCGVDLIFVAGNRIAGLPRTTLVEY